MILNAIKQMEEQVKQDCNIVSLSQGIPFLDSDNAIREAAISAISSGLADRYSEPEGLLELREAISEDLYENGMNFRPSEIVVTAGAMEALNVALHTVVGGLKKQIILPTPVYAAYFKAIELAGGEAVEIRLDEKDNWKLDTTLVEKSITPETAGILICNPNNPTGNIFDEATMRELARISKKHDIVLISDEVYGNLLFAQDKIFTPARGDEYRKNLIRVVSFSKDFSLTGWRIGYLHADESRIRALKAVHDTLVNCAPVISQYAAMAAIKNSSRIFKANKLVYRNNRDLMAGYLSRIQEYVDYTVPEATYFFFPKILGVKDSRRFCLDLLAHQKVAVVPGEAFGSGGEGRVRLCFGRSELEIHEGMKRLERFLLSR